MKIPFLNRTNMDQVPALYRIPDDSECSAIAIDVREGRHTLKELIALVEKGFPNHRYDQLYFVRAHKGTILLVADMNIVANRVRSTE